MLERDKIIKEFGTNLIDQPPSRTAIFLSRYLPFLTRTRYFSEKDMEKITKNLDFPIKSNFKQNPKSIKFCDPDSNDTAFWANILIAGSGTAAESQNGLDKKSFRSKDCTLLKKTMNDLQLLSELYEPNMIGDPRTVYPSSCLRSVGYFSTTEIIQNGGASEVKKKLENISEWILINKKDPEFEFVQLNILFSGHGNAGTVIGGSEILLGGAPYKIQTFVEDIKNSLQKCSEHGVKFQVNLFFDCCYAGAILTDILRYLCKKRLSDKENSSNFWVRRIYGSSLADEVSYEAEGVYNSLFTAAFLKENSNGKRYKSWPNLHDISFLTEFKQTPFMMDLSKSKEPLWRLPIIVALQDEVKHAIGSEEFQSQLFEHWVQDNDDGVSDIFIFDYYQHMMQVARECCTEEGFRISRKKIKKVAYEDRSITWAF